MEATEASGEGNSQGETGGMSREQGRKQEGRGQEAMCKDQGMDVLGVLSLKNKKQASMC